MLAIWGATAIAGAVHGDLKPAIPLQSVASRVATPAPTTVPTVATATAKVVKPEPAPAPAPKPKPKPAPAPKPKASTGKYIVVIDPGHGGELSGTEPQSPYSSTQKAKTASGATGTDGVTEAQNVLKIALKLRPLLEAQGVKVIMVRTGPAAISNVDRAKMANAAHADLFLRLHLDSAGRSTRGALMLVPAQGAGYAPAGPSRKAGDMIQAALLKVTGAHDRGFSVVSDMTGFNWCKEPTCLTEMANLDNPTDSALASSQSYQQKLAQGLADGTMQYLHTVR
jgi:N-acetylmuramoyl-L-alanine amidase